MKILYFFKHNPQDLLQKHRASLGQPKLAKFRRLVGWLIVQATRSEAPRLRKVFSPRNTLFCPVELGVIRSMHVTDRTPPDGPRDHRQLDRHARSGLVTWCAVIP